MANRVRWPGVAVATAPVSSNVAVQTACGRAAWASRAGKARHLSQHHPSTHASCAAWVREKVRAVEACLPHDAMRREMGPVGAAGSGSSLGGDGAPTAAHKPTSVLLSREQKAVGCWPVALAPSLTAVGPLPENSFAHRGLTGVGEGRRKVGSPFRALLLTTSEVGMGRHLWAVVPVLPTILLCSLSSFCAPHYPAMTPIILLSSHHPDVIPIIPLALHHPDVIPIIPLHSPPPCLAPCHPAVLPTRGCSLLPPALGHLSTHSPSPGGAGAVGRAVPLHREGGRSLAGGEVQ